VQDRDHIVEFRKFDNSIEASLAKTKLDAHGIPCFLTGENMANLYPGQQVVPFHIRLHIFQADVEQATLVLTEDLRIS
jgi:hypothetical protein